MGLGIVEATVAGKLVGLLAVLPTALPIALPGESGEPGTRSARQAQGQRQVDDGQRGAVAVLLGSPGGEHHGRRCLAEQPRGLVQLRHAPVAAAAAEDMQNRPL